MRPVMVQALGNLRPTDVRPCRLTLPRFFLLQLLVSPAFLGPLYYEMPGRNRPLVMLFAMLLAPACYVAVFAYRATVHSLAQQAPVRRSLVFAAIRTGMLYGLLFGLLIVGSLSFLWCRDTWSAGLTLTSAPLAWLDGAICGAFILLHYFLIGAATGGLVGLAVDVAVRSRFPQFASTNRTPGSY